VSFSFYLGLAACRMRSSARDTLSRSCARRVLCWSAFPLTPAVRSAGLAAGCPALFVGFIAVEPEEARSIALALAWFRPMHVCRPQDTLLSSRDTSIAE
jgi:hypothetical protein